MQFADNEQGLIQAAKNGDRNAFGRIYELYSARVYRYVRNLLGVQSDAEDTTAEVFIKVMRALPKYHEKGKFTAWLLRIARNETFNHLLYLLHLSVVIAIRFGCRENSGQAIRQAYWKMGQRVAADGMRLVLERLTR